MRKLILAAGLVLAASSASAQNANNPYFTRELQGVGLETYNVPIVAKKSECVFAATGTTCVGGVNFPAGDLARVQIQNIGSQDAYCDETSPAVNSAGWFLPKTAGGAPLLLERGLRSAHIYCYSDSGTTLAVSLESYSALATPNPSPTATPTPTPTPSPTPTP